jgi:hypothetical protein
MIPRLPVVLVLCSFLLAPGFLASQEPVEGSRQIHVVRPCDTLASIARQYLGSTAAWERIFEANRDVISDPHRIHPGMELTIPGVRVGPEETGVEVIRGVPDDVLAEVTGVVLEGEPVAERDTVAMARAVDDRRDLLRFRPFQPRGVPEPPMDRTVFHGGSQQSIRPASRPGVVVAAPEDALALSQSAFHSAAWITPRGGPREAVGRVTAFEGDEGARIERTTVQRYDRVLIDLDPAARVAVDDLVVAYRSVGEVPDLGAIQAPSGVLRIEALENEGAGAVARMVGGYDRFSLGHDVRLPRTFPLVPGVHPRATDQQLHGTLLAFRNEQEIYLPGDQGFIDRGLEDGVEVGDEFVGVVGVGEGREGRTVARFQVIWVDRGYATVRLLSATSPPAVRAGLPVALDRKMP